jgi:hypothetical protein
MDRLLVASPVPACVSADPGGGRHAEPLHPVEHIAADFCLGLLIGQSSGLKFPADDGLVAKHRGFNQTPAVVTLTTLPSHPPVLVNHCQMPISPAVE